MSLLFLQSSILAEVERVCCFSWIVFQLSCDGVQCRGLVCSVWLWYMYFLVRLTFWSFYLNSVNYFAIIIAIAYLFQVGYVGFLPPMASHLRAGVHFRNAIDHLHLTDMRFILHPLLINCMRLALLARASKQLLVHLYHLASHLFQFVIVAWSAWSHVLAWEVHRPPWWQKYGADHLKIRLYYPLMKYITIGRN